MKPMPTPDACDRCKDAFPASGPRVRTCVIGRSGNPLGLWLCKTCHDLLAPPNKTPNKTPNKVAA